MNVHETASKAWGDCGAVPSSPAERSCPPRLETFVHTQEVTRAEAVDVFASRSYAAALPEPQRSALLERVAEQVPKAEPVEIPYVTELYWTRKSP